MDCQQHERYANQYRAMFVMNIGVDWSKRFWYDDAVGGLKLDDVSAAGGGRSAGSEMQFDGGVDGAPSGPDTIPHDTQEHGAAPINQETSACYYSVHCIYCQWELAALDMNDEIYYFFGCIASA